MGSLNPTVGGDIGYEQAPSSPSVLSTILQTGSQILGNVGTPGTPRAPTSAEVQNAALTPYARRLEELRGSDLTDQQFTRQARLLERQYLSQHPELSTELRDIAGNYGVETPELEVSAHDALTDAQNEWITSPTGIEALNRVGAQAIVDGQLDEDRLGDLLQQEMAADLALDASVSRSNRELTLVENDVAAWRAGSETAMGDILPQLTDRASRTRESLIAMATSGDTSVDTPEEQLAFLREQRTVLREGMLADVQSANIHHSVYSTQLDTALQPIDDLINVFEASAGDTATILTATRNARTLQFENQMAESLGAWAVHPEFMRQGATIFAGQLYDRDTLVNMVELMNDQAAMGATRGLDFLPGLPRAEDAYSAGVAGTDITAPAVAQAIQSQLDEDEGAISSILSSATSFISAADGDTGVISRNFANITAAGGLDGRPVDTSMLGNIFSPENVRQYSTAVTGTDPESRDLLANMRYFQATQVTRNQEILEGALTNFPALSVEFRNNELVLLENGSVRRGVVNNEPRMQTLLSAISNINTINTAMRRIDPTVAPEVQDQRNSDFMDGLGDAIMGVGTGSELYNSSLGNDVLGVVDAGAGYTVIETAAGVSRRVGARNWRNHNPGNLEFGPFAEAHGAVGTDGRFAVFPSFEAGRAAQAALIFESGSYRNLTLADAIARYAPHFENDTNNYMNVVASDAGVSTSDRMSSFTAAQRVAILDSMQRVEGWQVGEVIGGPADPERRLTDPVGSSSRTTVAGVDVLTTEAEQQAAAVTQASAPTETPEGPSGTLDAAPVTTPTQETEFASVRASSGEQQTTGSSQTQTEEVARAVNSSAKILALLGRTQDQVPQFSSEAELNQAIQSGSVNPEDVVLVAGEVRVA